MIISTNQMFWPIIIKLTSLPGKILWSGAGRRPGEASPGMWTAATRPLTELLS